MTNEGDGTGHVPGIAIVTAYALVLSSVAVLVIDVHHHRPGAPRLSADRARRQGGSPQVARRLQSALTDLRSIAPAERIEIIDLQLELLTTATETSMDDERDTEMALRRHRERTAAASVDAG